MPGLYSSLFEKLAGPGPGPVMGSLLKAPAAAGRAIGTAIGSRLPSLTGYQAIQNEVRELSNSQRMAVPSMPGVHIRAPGYAQPQGQNLQENARFRASQAARLPLPGNVLWNTFLSEGTPEPSLRLPNPREFPSPPPRAAYQQEQFDLNARARQNMPPLGSNSIPLSDQSEATKNLQSFFHREIPETSRERGLSHFWGEGARRDLGESSRSQGYPETGSHRDLLASAQILQSRYQDRQLPVISGSDEQTGNGYMPSRNRVAWTALDNPELHVNRYDSLMHELAHAEQRGQRWTPPDSDSFTGLGEVLAYRSAREIPAVLDDIARRAYKHRQVTGKPLNHAVELEPFGYAPQADWMQQQAQRFGAIDQYRMSELLATPAGRAWLKKLYRPAVKEL